MGKMKEITNAMGFLGTDVDYENIEEELLLIEKGLNIKFENDELSQIHTFDDLTHLITNKIQSGDDSLCRSSHLFYKLRKFIAYIGYFDIEQLTPNTKLKDIFHSKRRRHHVRALEYYLGFKLGLLAPNHILLVCLGALFIVGVFNLFSSAIVGLIVMALAVFGFYLAFKFGKTLQYDTVRDLIEDVVLYNYLKVRKDTKTVNRKEIKTLLNKHYRGIMYVEEKELAQIRFSE